MYLIKIGGASQTSTLRFSAQQLTSCCNKANGCLISNGCDGGWSNEVMIRSDECSLSILGVMSDE